MADPRALVVVEVSGDWAYEARDVLDWIETKLASELPDGWGDGRGGINYAIGRAVSVRLSKGGR